MFGIMQKTQQVNKKYNYSKGKVTLSFSLNFDTKQSVRDFKDILVEALKDVEKTLIDLDKK